MGDRRLSVGVDAQAVGVEGALGAGAWTCGVDAAASTPPWSGALWPSDLWPSALWPSDLPALRRGRTHEARGAGARAFAAVVAAVAAGPVIWVRRCGATGRFGEALDAYGLAQFFDPGRLIEVWAARPRDALWAMEEALRSGAAPTTIAEIGRPLDLTASRRLQLAAEAGGGIGLALTPAAEDARSNAAETRWRVSPAPSPRSAQSGPRSAQSGPRSAQSGPRRGLGDSVDDGFATPYWRLTLEKNKRGGVGDWLARWRGRLELAPKPAPNGDAAPRLSR